MHQRWPIIFYYDFFVCPLRIINIKAYDEAYISPQTSMYYGYSRVQFLSYNRQLVIMCQICYDCKSYTVHCLNINTHRPNYGLSFDSEKFGQRLNKNVYLFFYTTLIYIYTSQLTTDGVIQLPTNILPIHSVYKLCYIIPYIMCKYTINYF